MSKPKAKRGFAAMTPAKRTAIARLGGAAVKPHRDNLRLHPHALHFGDHYGPAMIDTASTPIMLAEFTRLGLDDVVH